MSLPPSMWFRTSLTSLSISNAEISRAKAAQLRAYIDAMEKEARNNNLSREQNEHFNLWLSWARDHAERIDPLENGLPFTK